MKQPVRKLLSSLKQCKHSFKKLKTKLRQNCSLLEIQSYSLLRNNDFREDIFERFLWFIVHRKIAFNRNNLHKKSRRCEKTFKSPQLCELVTFSATDLFARFVLKTSPKTPSPIFTAVLIMLQRMDRVFNLHHSHARAFLKYYFIKLYITL